LEITKPENRPNAGWLSGFSVLIEVDHFRLNRLGEAKFFSRTNFRLFD